MTQMNAMNATMNNATNNATTATTVEYNIVMPHFKVIGDKIPTCEFVRIDEAIRYFQMARSHGTTMFAYNIVMPDPEDDEEFFYASVDAAKEGKYWVEEAHAFMSGEFKSSFEGGCLDSDDNHLLDEIFSEHGGWEEYVIDNVYADIFGYTPVTGEDGHAIVYDEDVANICRKYGYDATKFTFTKEGIEYWMIFPLGGEEEYLNGVYTQKKDTDPYNGEMFIDYHTRTGGEYRYTLDIEWFWSTEKCQWQLDGTRVKATITVENDDNILNMTIDGHTVNPIHDKSVVDMMEYVYAIFDETDDYYVEDGVAYRHLDRISCDYNGEELKNFLTAEALKEFGYGKDFNILADFIGDMVFSDDPWQTYEEYFDDDLWDCNSGAPRKRWAFDVCVWHTEKCPDWYWAYGDREYKSERIWIMNPNKTLVFSEEEIAYLKSLAAPTIVTAKVISTRDHNCGWRAKAYSEPNRKINGSGFKSASANFVYMWMGEVFCRQ